MDVAVGTPLANALQKVVNPKLVEMGWATGMQDDTLSEYIILMLANGKSQDQIASELSNDLLDLGPNDQSTIDFSQWLFGQLHSLNAQLNGPTSASTNPPPESEKDAMMTMDAQDADMGDVQDGAKRAIPTGPKGMRGNHQKARDTRMFGPMKKTTDRNSESTLHRIRGTSNTGRINSHSAREPPKGPRTQSQRNMGSSSRQQSMSQMPMGSQMPAGFGAGPQSQMMLNSDQQMFMWQMLGEQAGLLKELMEEKARRQAPRGNRNRRSLFERVEGNGPRKPPHAKPHEQEDTAMGEDEARPSELGDAMATDESSKDSKVSVCRFNLSCTRPDCPFAHQSPAAPPGVSIDLSDECSFGAACTSKKCVGKHPSPAKRMLHQAEQECMYGGECTKYPMCSFKHTPATIPCRNGADCTTSGCKFYHSEILCKFDPCLKRGCKYKHAEGQKRGSYSDKVWTADGLQKDHVSERKFVSDENGVEEVIIPGRKPGDEDLDTSGDTEVVTEPMA